MGRKPFDFTEQLKNRVLDLYNAGATDQQVARAIGVSRQTLFNLRGRDQEFANEIKQSKTIADEIVVASLFQRAVGYKHREDKVFYNAKADKVRKVKMMRHYPPDTMAAMFWLQNRQPEKWRRGGEHLQQPSDGISNHKFKLTFEQFCISSGYPVPYAKQNEMRDFVVCLDDPRLLLGSRGYGKTDYAVIMGLAYHIYSEWYDKKPVTFSCLLVTKSEERNAAILAEIQKACELHGVRFEKANSLFIRVEGHKGKDHTISSITIGSASTRGRHPDLIVMDDPVTPEDTSAATRKRVVKLYEELHKLCSNIVIIGQPVHKQDLYQKLRGILKKLEVPHGTIPELDADLEAQRLAGVSEESIQASYHLTITTSDFAPFDKISYVQKFEPSDCVAFIDPSFEGGDFTALTIMRGYFDGVMVKGRTFKKAWNHCIKEMCEEMVRCGVKKVCFETNSLGDQPLIMLREILPNGIGVMGKKSTTNKHSRIMNAGAYAESIHLARDSDAEYIEQVVTYEYGIENDDAPDSLASCLGWLGLIREKQRQG